MSEFGQAVELFVRAADRTVETCRAIPAAQWSSFADILEHMAIANGFSCKRLEALIDREAADSFASAVSDDEIPYLFWRAPEPPGIAVPTGTWLDRVEAIERFRDGAATLAALAHRDPGDMRHKGDAHPLFGPLDGVQWALFAAAHTERHRAEMVGMKQRIAAA